MCRHTLKPHLLAKVTRCACRHIGAHWTTTRSSPRWALAPGNASPGLSNARLGQTPRWCPTLPRLRVSTTKRAARHCAAALRRLRATSQSRYLVNHRPPTARPALAPGTAALARVNARLTRLFWLASVHEKSALRVHQSERWSAVTVGHASLRLVLTGGSGPLTVSHTLRFYITPHFVKWPAIRSQARSVAGHRFAPFGFTKQALCKVSDLGGAAGPQKPWGPYPTPFFVPQPRRVVCVRRSLVRRFAQCF
jgi:hypothetical protein